MKKDFEGFINYAKKNWNQARYLTKTNFDKDQLENLKWIYVGMGTAFMGLALMDSDSIKEKLYRTLFLVYVLRGGYALTEDLCTLSNLDRMYNELVEE